jgi:hypothetical protein
MARVLKHGQMDTSTQVSLKIVYGVGQGILAFPDGSTYDGEWANGFMNGQGHIHLG